jgi:4-diphosphocytidyl-2-C-methyl-D-erythritol kinase
VAATTLLALNALWDLGWSRAELARLGLSLGADVPVFVLGRAAWAEGVGEILAPLELPEPWYVVLAPAVPVATAEVFRAIAAPAGPGPQELTAYTPAITIRDFFAGQGRNDLEPVARRLYPAVGNALDWLGQYGRARMTGSGGCVFLDATNEAAARRILAQAPAPLTGFVARGINRHPL